MAVMTIAHAVVQNSDSSWDNRPTSSTTELILWVRTVPGSADPAAATSPSVTGAYGNDIVVGP